MEIGNVDSTSRHYYSLQESRKCYYPILDGVIQLQLTGMKLACLRFELVDTRNQQSNIEVDWQKVFNVLKKCKNTKIKCIYIQNTLDFFQRYLNTKCKYIFFISNTYFKYMYLKYCPSLCTIVQQQALRQKRNLKVDLGKCLQMYRAPFLYLPEAPIH